jgi:hypothetical protein
VTQAHPCTRTPIVHAQIKPGQAFNTRGLPAGRYRIEVVLDARRRLREQTRANNRPATSTASPFHDARRSAYVRTR